MALCLAHYGMAQQHPPFNRPNLDSGWPNDAFDGDRLSYSHRISTPTSPGLSWSLLHTFRRIDTSLYKVSKLTKTSPSKPPAPSQRGLPKIQTLATRPKPRMSSRNTSGSSGESKRTSSSSAGNTSGNPSSSSTSSQSNSSSSNDRNLEAYREWMQKTADKAYGQYQSAKDPKSES